MGAAASITATGSLNSSSEVKVYRQVKEEYLRLKQDLGMPDTEIGPALVAAHDRFVTRALGPPEGWKCPTVRFGRTELAMPIITCGGMRQQTSWMVKDGFSVDDVPAEQQSNFQAIVDRCVAQGMVHFETAIGYGTSGLQFGKAIKKHPREQLIIQTKVVPKEDPEEFRAILERAIEHLDCGYLDLFGFHGINRDFHVDWILREGGCMAVVEELRAAGRIRHVGFSTHGPTPVIVQAINTGRFDYVNLHYQFVGSYISTASGSESGTNLEALQAAKEQDMGVFIISPVDKGGKLYKPSRKFSRACAAGGLTPIAFNDLYLWSHDPPIHTLSIGAARPEDFDEHVEAAMLLPRARELVEPVEATLRDMMVRELGQDWVSGWWRGCPGCYTNDAGVHVAHMAWLWSLCKAWGMFSYAADRYDNIKGNTTAWDDSKTPDENRAGWGFVPGTQLRPGTLEAVEAAFAPDAPMKERVMAAIQELHAWLSAENRDEMLAKLEDMGMASAYDLQPWVPYPERNRG